MGIKKSLMQLSVMQKQTLRTFYSSTQKFSLASLHLSVFIGIFTFAAWTVKRNGCLLLLLCVYRPEVTWGLSSISCKYRTGLTAHYCTLQRTDDHSMLILRIQIMWFVANISTPPKQNARLGPHAFKCVNLVWLITLKHVFFYYFSLSASKCHA